MLLAFLCSSMFSTISKTSCHLSASCQVQLSLINQKFETIDAGSKECRSRRNRKASSHLQFLHRHVQAREETVDELKERLEKLNKEIQTLQAEGLQESELKIHIEKLHEYNMLKDVGQAVLGQLASLRCVSTQDVYKDYGLDLED